MGLIERLKSALGLGGSASPSRPDAGRRDRPSGTDDAGAGGGRSTDRAGSEPAGTDGGAGSERAGENEGVDVTVEHEPDTASEDAVKGTEPSGSAGGKTDGDLEDIKGIGPTYAERLREAGVGSVDELAAADAADLAEASGIAESRIEKWVDRAETH